MGNTPPKIIFPWQCRNENQGKLRVRFKLQVGNPWTNLAEIWLTYCQLVFLKTVFFCVRILNSFFVFELEYFPTGSATGSPSSKYEHRRASAFEI